ncbi:MAG: 3-ketoacyl-ACP reductase [Clostridia bacterium]|nr:3-ketoacyl-ACP reductase [Clostridia bacterium]
MKTAIITGSSRGIGLGIAKKLFEDGYFVIVTSSSYREETEKCFSELFGDRHAYVPGDIKERSTWEALVGCAKKLGRLDLLVNNAGIAPPVRNDILVATEESYDLVMDTNLKSVFFLTQMCANFMVEMLGRVVDFCPRIVNIGSMSAYTSSTSRGEYCISKAGVSMVTTLFADRLAEYNIPVFEVRPGIIATDMTGKVKEKYDKLIAEGITPIKRWGTPEDIAGMVSSLASGNFDFGTGTVFNADGGFHMRRL